MNRKKFFSSFGIGVTGLLLMRSFPFKFFQRKNSHKKVSVKINPLAVKREKAGGKNA